MLDLTKETAETKKLYGIDNPATEVYGRRLLAARRLAQTGVRFTLVYLSDYGEWDSHNELQKNCTPAAPHAGGAAGVDLPQVVVRVPLAVVAEVDQGEPHPALGQPPRGEQPAAVDGRWSRCRSRRAAGSRPARGQVEHLGDRLLHPEGQLVRLDPGPELVVVGILDRGEAVQLVDEVELLLLLLRPARPWPRARRGAGCSGRATARRRRTAGPR